MKKEIYTCDECGKEHAPVQQGSAAVEIRAHLKTPPNRGSILLPRQDYSFCSPWCALNYLGSVAGGRQS